MLGSVALGLLALQATASHAMGLLRQNSNAMFELRSYRASCFMHYHFDPHRHKKDLYQVASLSAEKPLQMRYDRWDVSTARLPDEPTDWGIPIVTFACNGKTRIRRYNRRYRVDQDVLPGQMGTYLEPWEGFYSKKSSILGETEALKAAGGSLALSYVGIAAVGGVPCDVVAVHETELYGEDRQKMDYHDLYYLGRRDHLVRRLTSKFTVNSSDVTTMDAEIRDLAVNEPVNESLFEYSPPANASLVAPNPSLLPPGKIAPDFVAIGADGKQVSLSTFRGKVVVLDFWSSWCGPCKESMPHTQQVAEGYPGTPVVVLAIDDLEPRNAFRRWVLANKGKYPNVYFAYVDPKEELSSKSYQVSSIPTQYVIDKGGVVRFSIVGYDAHQDDLTKALDAISKFDPPEFTNP